MHTRALRHVCVHALLLALHADEISREIFSVFRRCRWRYFLPRPDRFLPPKSIDGLLYSNYSLVHTFLRTLFVTFIIT